MIWLEIRGQFKAVLRPLKKRQNAWVYNWFLGMWHWLVLFHSFFYLVKFLPLKIRVKFTKLWLWIWPCDLLCHYNEAEVRGWYLQLEFNGPFSSILASLWERHASASLVVSEEDKCPREKRQSARSMSAYMNQPKLIFKILRKNT